MSNLNNNTASLQAILETINALPEEVVLPTLTNEGAASDMLSGKELINSSGKKVTGIIPNNGSVSQTMDGINTKTISIPAGYTTGGTVGLDGSIDNAVANALNALAEKDVEIPSDTNINGLAELIAAIEVGGNIAYGTITPTSASGIEVTHNLGVIPTTGIFVKTDGKLSSTSEVFGLFQSSQKVFRTFSYKGALDSNDNAGDGKNLLGTVSTYYFWAATATTVKTPPIVAPGVTYFWAVMK